MATTVLSKGQITITDLTDPPVIYASPNNIVIPTAFDGTFTGTYISTISIYQGGTLSTGWSFSLANSGGLTATFNSTTRELTITALSTDSGTSTITASKTGFDSLYVTIQVAKVKAGKTPVKNVDYFDGQNGTSVKVQYSADNSNWHDAPQSGDLYIRTGTKAAGATDYTWAAGVKFVPEKGVEYKDGENGLSSYLHIKYSNDVGSTFTGNNGEDPGAYIGTYTDSTEADSTNPASYSWVKILGDKGDKGDTGSPGLPGSPGTPGINGTKAISINAYKWSLTPITTAPSKAFTYNWSNKTVSAYPDGWAASAPASTVSGETLYTLTIVLTADAAVTETNANWSDAGINIIGFRQDGSIGPIGTAGAAAVRAYKLVLSPSLPSAPEVPGQTITTGSWSAEYTKWYDTPPTTVVANEWLFQADGTRSATGVYSWISPTYLSTFKVGKLSALTTDTGTLTIGQEGHIKGGQDGYNSGKGFFLGYSGTDYVFSLGNSAGTSLTWNGDTLTIGGAEAGTLATNAANALTKAGIGQTLSGDIALATGGIIYSGTTTTGVALTPTGLKGLASGVETFSISASTGAATFKGSLQVTSSTSYPRMDMTNNNIVIYDGTGTVRVKIGSL